MESAKKKLFIVIGIIVALLIVALVGIRIYYNGHWYPNTDFAGTNLSGMTLSESQSELEKVYSDYALNITGRDDGKMTITKEEITYSINIQDFAKEEFDRQHDSFSFFSLFTSKKKVEGNPEVTYDESQLSELLNSCELSKGSSAYPIVTPEDAKVIYSKETGTLQIQNEVIGNTLKQDAFDSVVSDALQAGVTDLKLTDQSVAGQVYEAPVITADSEELKTEMTAWNAAVIRWIKWKVSDGVVETITPKQIYKWIKYKNGKIKYKTEKVNAWVEKKCLKYKTLGGTRTFINHNGKKVTVAGGDYGWQLDYETMRKQTMKMLKQPMDATQQQAYIDGPSAETKKALTIKKKAICLGSAYQFNVDNKMEDYDTQNYTEVSLADQMVYVFRKGKVVFSCPTISGLPVEGRQTRTGAYFIKEHKSYNVLKGADYSTPVHDWVRITWTGTGFHEAHWKNWSAWSKDYYKTAGSHGCLNLSPENAKKIFDLVKYKEIVFLYN